MDPESEDIWDNTQTWAVQFKKGNDCTQAAYTLRKINK